MNKINKEKQTAVPQMLLRELFDYDELTGVFTRIKKPSKRGNTVVGQIAGSVNKNGYICISINGHRYQAHRLAWAYVHGDYPEGEQPFIDHINGKKDDNRIVNLRISSHADNMRNMRMNSRNTSGMVGVRYVEKEMVYGIKTYTYHYWVAQWYDEKGKHHGKNFSVEKLGEATAKQMATDYRTEQIRLLQVNHGVTYSERHGV